MPHIQFEKATEKYQQAIFEWLEEQHMKEFWDNSQAHKDDILNFINGRKTPSSYFNGIFTYWIGLIEDQPYCLIMTGDYDPFSEDLSSLHRSHLSKTGNTISIDFGIGNTKFLGKGLAAPTLISFTKFYQTCVDQKTDTFFIDPNENNPRAQHVYEKAGFKLVGDFNENHGYFEGLRSLLMVKKLTK